MLGIILQIVLALPAIIKAVGEIIPLVQEAEASGASGDEKRRRVLEKHQQQSPEVSKHTSAIALEVAVKQALA